MTPLSSSRSPSRPSKLPDVGLSIFSEMTALANTHGAINLSQGFPDFDCDPALIALVDAHMRAGRNQYAPMQGVLPLREAIARKYQALYGATYDPTTDITVTSGATEALFDAIIAFVSPGDEVLVIEPCYDSYVPAITLAGGRPVFVSLRYPDYAIDWDEVRRAITRRTRLMLVNTPHNPTGTVWSSADIDGLRSVVDGTDIIVVSDEVYEHIIFDGIEHQSLARYPDLASRSLVVGSFGKTLHTTGWKIGYAAAPAALADEFRKVHQFVTFTSNTAVQYAIADYLARPETYLGLPAFYQAKRDRFLDLVRTSRFAPIACRGSYFQLLDYSAITNEGDRAFALRMTAELGVAAIPTSAFLYRQPAPPVLRFCFAKQDETLRKAAERLCRL
ncbi:MAG: methionine aminotransferase [Vicinamibacterales bacterium]